MPPSVVRFMAGVGRRVLLWFVAAIVIAAIRHALRAHH